MPVYVCIYIYIHILTNIHRYIHIYTCTVLFALGLWVSGSTVFGA